MKNLDGNFATVKGTNLWGYSGMLGQVWVSAADPDTGDIMHLIIIDQQY